MLDDSVFAIADSRNAYGDAEHSLVRPPAIEREPAVDKPLATIPAAQAAQPTPHAIEHSRPDLWLGLGVCIIGVSLFGAGVYLRLFLRKERQ